MQSAPKDFKGLQPNHPAIVARRRRRVDWMMCFFAAVHESAFGTSGYGSFPQAMSAFDLKRTLTRTRALFMGEAVLALLALATLRLWHLQKYVHEVGFQPGHLTRHPVL